MRRLSLTLLAAFGAFFVFYRLFHLEKSDKLAFKCPLDEDEDRRVVRPIPNVVHFIHLDSARLSFVGFVCILAAFYNQNPAEIVFNSNIEENVLLNDARFARAKNATRFRYRRVSKPTHVFGQPLSGPHHATDVLRIKLAIEEGGIFVDEDTFIVRPLEDTLMRRHNVILGRKRGEFLGTQYLALKPNSSFARLWLASYKDYRPTMWYYNAGEKPTVDILDKCPNLVHVEEELIGVSNTLAKELYVNSLWNEWRKFYAIHLLSGHRRYLFPDVDPEIEEFDEDNIRTYGKTFGEMARSVLNRLVF